METLKKELSKRKLELLLFIPLFILFLLETAPALAQTVVAVQPGPGSVAPQPDGPVAWGVNLWLIVLGIVVRGLMYFVNHYALFLKTEAQKQTAVAIVGAVAGALYQLITAHSIGFNDVTFNAVLQTLLVTLVAHNVIFKPGDLNLKLGGGTNSDGSISDRKLAAASARGERL